jgi:hypothetical protein
MSYAEMFLLVWALTMTALWQVNKFKYKLFVHQTFNTVAAVADGEGKFVRTESNTIMFKEIE